MKNTPRAKELATKRFESLTMGDREIGAYLRTNGDYAIRLYLPAGESCGLPEYAYVGPDVNLARAAWKHVVAKWTAMYANDKRMFEVAA